ncbi:hypothetical protein IWQ60_006608 [Tieghemiomyces parasiticus]|uniref:Uncharacterized protein n=1 Tax=Tieghemiomyces parasiticus TaxID=78921 RepID=A0A9W8A3I4_9FUNG|nr:hypothetical protein IWQ60_006608 [Tieghemiomyces parasiticus]
MVARGLDTELIVRVPEARTAVYNAIHNAGGELITAVADMDILATAVLPTVQRDALQAALMSPPGPVLVCFDGNLSQDTIRQLCATLSAIPRGPWTVFEPTSAAKALKLLATCPFDPQVRSSLTPFRETVVQLVTPDRAELASLADALPTELNANQLLVTIDDMMAASCATARSETNRPTPPAYPADLPLILQKAASLLTFIPHLVVKLGADGVIVCIRSRSTG